MKILSAKQTQQADSYTIKNEPVSSLDLMERAVKGLAAALASDFPENTHFKIFCGKGNNGGDGLALARLLCRRACPVEVVIVEHSNKASDDFKANLQRLEETKATVYRLTSANDLIIDHAETVLVDSILGSGLSRPLEGLIAQVAGKINQAKNRVVAIDIPTGLFADENTENDLAKVVKADHTLTFQYPKLSMMHKDTAALCGRVEVVNIGLHPDFLGAAPTSFHYVTKGEVKALFKPREKFSYKGTYGHALLLAGSKGSMGAAIMSAKAALRAGAGLLTVGAPGCGLQPLQSALAEAMVRPDRDEAKLTEHPDLKPFNAIGAGPGMGTDVATAKMLNHIIQNHGKKMVLDADALNILAKNQDWLNLLPPGCILTPHPGEFKRLLGMEKIQGDYLDRLRDFAMSYGIIVVLKDAITTIAAPDGQVYFMDFGSPALASPGSGDVLTGVILGLLAGSYSPLQAAVLGVYLQARAGRVAGERFSLESALASDVINSLGKVFRELY